MNNKARGTVFENRVANVLRELGYTVWRNCYVPVDGHYTQVDIIALRDDHFLTVECKNWKGIYDVERGLLVCGGRTINCFATQQSYYHAKCIGKYTHAEPDYIAAFPDSTGVIQKHGREYHISELKDLPIPKGKHYRHVRPTWTPIFDKWANVSDAVKKQHLLYCRQKKGAQA